MKMPKPAYTVEFTELAVKRVKEGHSISAVLRRLGLSNQNLRNWVKAAEGRRNGAGGRVMTPEEVELSRPRAENLRLIPVATGPGSVAAREIASSMLVRPPIHANLKGAYGRSRVVRKLCARGFRSQVTGRATDA